MELVINADAARSSVREIQRISKTVGLVPTMGALHDGHMSLVRAATSRCDAVAVTIFVNPLQFGPNEDLDSYPRTLDADLLACEKAGVDIVFAPSVETMYGDRSVTKVQVSDLTDGLCGAERPGHFDGVATVVAKLFGILPCDAAFFGEKDFQQLAVIKRMVRDLNMPIAVVGCPTLREPDGLAMSSRNAYLSPTEREQAVSLSQSLFAAVRQLGGGETDLAVVLGEIRETILSAGPVEIEYVSAVDPETLEPLHCVDQSARICVAVRIGSCRLIDNVGVDAPIDRE